EDGLLDAPGSRVLGDVCVPSPLHPIYPLYPLFLHCVALGEEPCDADLYMIFFFFFSLDDNFFSIFPSSKVGKDIDIYEIAPYGISCFGNRGGPRGIRTNDLIPNEKGMLPSQKGVKRPRGKSLTRKPSESGLKGHYHT
ncbi:hypothetical protein, partial [Salmonella enterica]|uniref:hypothetical protein n=1 Tax=Salmonella enterica TaxID=28901 RepID=UPI0035930844